MKMLKFLGAALLVAVAAGACKKNNPGDTAYAVADGPLSVAYTARLNTVLDSACTAMGIKGASAALLVPNAGIWKKGYGFSHGSQPINTNMALTIGSNTKTYIAALALKLQEQGKLNINDTIGKWLRNKPYVNGKVTIKQLLNHTSGFGDFSFNPAFILAIKSDFEKIWQPAEVYPFFEAPYFTTPGSAYSYSDQNTFLVGEIIAAVTQKPVEQSLRQLILAPAGLPNTVYYPFEPTALAIPHSWSADYSGNGELEDLDAVYGYSRKAFCSADNAAGGMLSTGEENARFWHLLMSGRIINNTSLALMKEFVATGQPNEGYGLSLQQKIGAFNGRTVLAHNGYVPGSINDNLYDTQSGVCIVLLTNQDKVQDLSPILDALHKVSLQYSR